MTGWLIEQEKYFEEREREGGSYTDFSGDFEVVSSSTISLLETSSFSLFELSSTGLVDDSSTVGEFRCCSSSYSLINRFFNECALLNVLMIFGEVANGGVLLEGPGELFPFDESC